MSNRMKIEEPKINTDKDEIEECRRKEREYIKSKFSELIGKQILIRDTWTEKEFDITVDGTDEIDLPFPRQCIVNIRWLDGKEEQCIGSSFFRKITEPYKSREIFDLKTREIVLTSDVNTERKLNNYDDNNMMDRYLRNSIIKGSRLPAHHRRYEIIDTINT